MLTDTDNSPDMGGVETVVCVCGVGRFGVFVMGSVVVTTRVEA